MLLSSFVTRLSNNFTSYKNNVVLDWLVAQPYGSANFILQLYFPFKIGILCFISKFIDWLAHLNLLLSPYEFFISIIFQFLDSLVALLYMIYICHVWVSLFSVSFSSNFLLILFKWMFPSLLKHIHDGCHKYFSIKFNIWKYSVIVIIDWFSSSHLLFVWISHNFVLGFVPFK